MTSVIHTTAGPVKGFIDTHHLSQTSTHSLQAAGQRPVQKYLGIPYGQAERWGQAKPASKWTQTRECVEFGPACPQLPSFLSTQFANTDGFISRTHVGLSESDMFTVNVYSADQVKQGDEVPVMVWIYGGSWRDGAASDILYDPTVVVRNAERPMIIVTLNYRVNIFGFLASKDLVDEDGLVGNYGVRDQLLALKWVNANIDKFGGDKNNVTIYGESAGAGSVGYHIGGVDPLFKRAICQSGAGSTMSYNPLTKHEDTWTLLLKHFEISSTDPDRVKKARALSTDAILEFLGANLALSWSACQESGSKAIWSSHPDVRLTNGEWVDSLESVLTGCCQDEGPLFADLFNMTRSQRTVNKFIDAHGEAGKYFKQAYPGLDDVANHQGTVVDHPASLMLHDALFDGPVRYLADMLSTRPHKRTGKRVEVYLYKSEAILPTWFEFGWGVHHACDRPLVFNSATLWNNDDSRPEAKSAADFGSKWTNFAFNGDPGAKWPQYDKDKKLRYVFEKDGGSRVESVTNAGTSEQGIALQAKIIPIKWGIGPKVRQSRLLHIANGKL